MWARVVEVALACWLAMSPFLFRYGPDERGLWASDYICATLIATFALFSYWPRVERIHLLSLGVAGWLLWTAFRVPDPPPPPPYQNYVIVGLLLLIFAIIPSHASEQPRAWREFQPNQSPRSRR